MRLRKLGKGQSVTFCVTEEIKAKILALKPKGEMSITVEDVLFWSMSETFSELKRNIPLWAVQGLHYLEHDLLWADARQEDHFDFLAEDVQKFLEPESQTLEQRYEFRSSSDPQVPTPSEHASRHADVGKIRERCLQYEAQNFDNATLLEEQERELSPEIEEERHTERPAQVQAHKHALHADVAHLIKTGVLLQGSKAFRAAFATLQTSSASSHYKATNVQSTFLVTTDFAKTVVAKGTSDSFFRMPQWIVTIPGGTGGAPSQMVVISPFEAQELLPDIERHQKVTLHLYHPRTHQGHKSLDKLDLFTLGRPLRQQTIPYSLVLQLNVFAGQTYLTSFEEYEETCDFLGLRSRPATDEETTQLAGTRGAAISSTPTSSDHVKPDKEGFAEFVKVLLTKVRRDCESIDKTHLGRMLYGAILTEKDFDDRGNDR